MGFFDLSCVFFFFQILVALVEWLSSQVTIKILVLLVRSRLVRGQLGYVQKLGSGRVYCVCWEAKLLARKKAGDIFHFV